MKFDLKGTTLIITMELPKKGTPSKSGKSLVLASTSGNKNTGLKHNNEDIVVGLNAYTKNGGQ